MLTLNQIIAQIQTLAAAHAQISSSGVGDKKEWENGRPDRVYPILWINSEGRDISDQYVTDRINIICADRVRAGEEGDDTDGHEQEVISDRLSVMLDIIAWFAQQHGQTYIIERSGRIEPFTEEGPDRVAGCGYTLNIKQIWDFAKCPIPESGAVIPPSVDGLTLYDFCDASVLARLTPAQVACLEAAYGTTCDPVTVEINGTEVGTPASGSTFSVKVTLDGSEAGSWDGVDTWEVTSDPCADAAYNLKKTGGGLIGSGTIPSGGSADITAPDATANLKDSAGNAISTTAIQSDSAANITAPNGTVNVINSDGDPIDSVTVKSNGTETYEIQDVAWTDTNGTAQSTPYGDAITCASADAYAFLPSTNAKLAIGTKKMISAYAGNLFRFRKSTGGTEFNVAAGTYGYPDVTTAQTNLGADAGFMVRVYDNLGLYDGYWTASTAPQPRLAMAKGDSRKAVQLAHISNQYMQCDMPVSAGETWTIYMSWTPNEMAGGMVLCGGGTGSPAFKWWINTDTLNRVYLYDGLSQNPATSNYSVVPRAPQVLAVQFKTNSLRVYVNGELILQHNTWSVQASTYFQIARRVDGGGSIGQFNWNGIYAHAGEYSSAIMTTMCNIFLR